MALTTSVSSCAISSLATTSAHEAFPQISIISPLCARRGLDAAVAVRQSSTLLRHRRAGKFGHTLLVAAGLHVSSSSYPDALLFDCDGVLMDTERDGHRVSFNQAFQEKGWDVTWDVELYGELLKIGGGKERMTHYFNKVGWPAGAPAGEQERKDLIAGLHKRKTTIFMDLVETGALPLRPGVARLVDEARASGVKVAVCSTSNERAVSSIVRVMLGAERASIMTIFAGDVVPRKKPDPAIYNLAATTLGVSPSRCVVIEDSHIGVTAAKAAEMTCVVTKSGYTADEDFSAADGVFDCIGDGGDERFGMDYLCRLVAAKVAA